MSFISCANRLSLHRGYRYFKERKVVSYNSTGESRYIGMVLGSGDEKYITTIDIGHPYSSMCSCKHAQNGRVICKHMIALYFEMFPEEAERLYREDEKLRRFAEGSQDETEQAVLHYICHMNKAELEYAFIEMFFGGPEWQYEQFIKDHGIMEQLENGKI